MIYGKYRRLIDDFHARLRAVVGTELVSLIVFGSAARGSADGALQVDVCVVLQRTDALTLERISPVTRSRCFARINPLLVTEEYLRRSADVFPIEFLDMKDNHVVIAGSDVLSGLTVDPVNLGFECEHELKAKLLQIKRAYAKDTFDPGMVLKSASSCGHILGAFYRLSKGTAVTAEEALSLIGTETGKQATSIAALLSLRQAAAKPGKGKVRKLLAGFIDELDAIVTVIDRIRG